MSTISRVRVVANEPYIPLRIQLHQRTPPCPFQPHPYQNNQPAQRPLPRNDRLIETRPLPRTPLGHINRKSLHEAQGNDHAIALERQLEIPEGDGDAFGRGAVGQLARFDLQGDDVVEVFEVLGGDGGGDDGKGLCELRVQS